ncbi:MAG: SDR family NAD(P)-dependent oxidoreductase [Nitrososphaerales archaeon]
MKQDDLRGTWALVTGASSGLGVGFARNLAARGSNLILAARREDRLRTVQQSVTARYGVEADVFPMDLEPPEAPQRLYDALEAAGRSVDVLINNAGFGLYGEFVKIPWERERAMLELDIVTLTHLTKLFVKNMVARRFGHVLLVASIGAYQPSPTYATYSAAKSYVLSFGQALHYELRKTGVNVTVVSPGVTRTEFLEVAGHRPSLYQRAMMMESADVTRIAVDAMLKGKASVVTGYKNAAIARLMRLLPGQLAARMTERSMTIGSPRRSK